MLKNLKFLARLMAFLRIIDPKTPLPKELEPELKDRMKEQPFKRKLQELAVQGEVPDKAIFLIAGYIIVYYLDNKKEMRVVRIYKAEQIIAIDAFMQHKDSPYYILAGRHAVMITISYLNMQYIYENIPAVDELARKTAASYENLEKQRDELMNKSNKEKILDFYSDKKDLLPAKLSAVPDKYIASYLRINLYTFRRLRNQLIAEKLL